MTPDGFVAWLECYIEDEIDNKPTVAQWKKILDRIDQINNPADCMGHIGFVDYDYSEDLG